MSDKPTPPEVDYLDLFISLFDSKETKPIRLKKQKKRQWPKRGSRRKGTTTSKYKGVCWNKPKQKWRARFSYKGERELIGDFECEMEAAKAVDKRLKEVLPHNQFLKKANFVKQL